MTALPASADASGVLPRRAAVAVFLAFAFAYFLSALVRAVTATLSPVLTDAFGLLPRDLGLLAGGYFLGFAAVQLPLGRWLDRHGPKRVILGCLSVAVLGCAAFAAAGHFWSLMAARVLCGVGVGACLMAPLTGYRRWFAPALQLRANAWMLMTGSLGMVASTLPVQWALPHTGWRALFAILAALVLLAMALIAWCVPRWRMSPPGSPLRVVRCPPRGLALLGAARRSGLQPPAASASPAQESGYAAIWRDPGFRRLAPVGFVNYGGLVALQTLWIGPWLTQVAGRTAEQAAAGLFAVNLAMLVAFWCWGAAAPALAARGIAPLRLIVWGQPLSFAVLALILIAGRAVWAPAWAAFCVASTFVTLAQPAVAMGFAPHLAGRALSAYNLVLFAGVFTVQWGIGLLLDAGRALGLDTLGAWRLALGVFLACAVAAWAVLLRGGGHNAAQQNAP